MDHVWVLYVLVPHPGDCTLQNQHVHVAAAAHRAAELRCPPVLVQKEDFKFQDSRGSIVGS